MTTMMRPASTGHQPCDLPLLKLKQSRTQPLILQMLLALGMQCGFDLICLLLPTWTLTASGQRTQQASRQPQPHSRSKCHAQVMMPLHWNQTTTTTPTTIHHPPSCLCLLHSRPCLLLFLVHSHPSLCPFLFPCHRHCLSSSSSSSLFRLLACSLAWFGIGNALDTKNSSPCHFPERESQKCLCVCA